MPDKDNWKEDVEKKLDEAEKQGHVDKELYDLIKKLLKAAKTAGDFAKVLEKEGILGKLGSAKKLGMKAASVVIDILIQLVEAGPCPWTAIIVARLVKLMQDALIDEDDKRYKALSKLHEKYSAVYTKCQREANGQDKPKDVNKATPQDLKNAGISPKLAKMILEEAAADPFHTPNELLRVPGAQRDTISKILEGGFYFGLSGFNMLNGVKRRKRP